MIQEIKNSVHNAIDVNQKVAIFQLQVLKNAAELYRVDAGIFCQAIDVPDSYKTEFQKMLNLARIMEQQGINIAAQHSTL
jgi:hypothetical protein